MNERENRPCTQAQAQAQVVDLLKYVDDKFSAAEKLNDVRFDGIEKAIAEATRLMELRLESMNGIQAQLDRQAKTFLPATLYEVQHKSLADRIDDLVQVASTHVTRSELLAVAALVSAATSAAVMVLLHVLLKV